MTWLDRPSRGGRSWRLNVLRRRRFVRWLLAFSVLVMLGQQTAMAAYACMAAPSAMQAMSTTKAMGPGCPAMHPRAQRAVCLNHCSTQATSPADAHVTSVPPSGLTALPPLSLEVASNGCLSSRASERWYRQQASPPHPPRLLFCSLQI